MAKESIDQTKNILTAVIATILLTTIISIFYTVLSPIIYKGTNISGFFYSIAQFLGLMGFLGIFLLIFTGDTARFFDKYYGIDKIIKTQRKFAIFTYFIVFSHPIFFILSNISYINNILPNFKALPLAFGTISLYIFAGIMISSLSYKKISYKVWQYLHILTYILFITIWYHAFNNGSSISSPTIKIIFYITPILVAIGAIYRTNYKIKQRKNEFILKNIEQETEDTFTLVVETKQKISFKPGQFFFLKLDNRKLYARHPFSVSSSPSEKNLCFTIKLSGRFTQEALKLKPGDEIKIEGPFGNFIIDGENKDLVFIAGGVGITPFMSMIKENQNKEAKYNIILFYSSKTEKDIIFKKQLDLIKENWFKKKYIITRENIKKQDYESGRINKAMLIKHIQDFKNKKFYICGPQKMNHSVSQILREQGVKKTDIISEDFFW